ncbi:GntR family transcriptional regulator [Niallia sp. XMNu-256]|uniref:FadR/GntR family transcriptional regulator n=1 Tax=Niallia sp. XMNu-256 TaxID=3082444 RepID=UPI0030CA80E9
MSDEAQVNVSQANSKVYLEIVKQLKGIIEQNRLNPGDRLPSERELSERLHVGRSSVREALRALELLGLIETKRGEGTYIRNFRDHQLIPLLGTFILQEDKSKQDVVETKTLIEKDCLTLIMDKKVSDSQLANVIAQMDEEQSFDDFMVKMIELANNNLVLRIWLILKDYYHTLGFKEYKPRKEDYVDLIKALTLKDQEKVFKAYEKVRGLSNKD